MNTKGNWDLICPRCLPVMNLVAALCPCRQVLTVLLLVWQMQIFKGSPHAFFPRQMAGHADGFPVWFPKDIGAWRVNFQFAYLVAGGYLGSLISRPDTMSVEASIESEADFPQRFIMIMITIIMGVVLIMMTRTAMMMKMRRRRVVVVHGDCGGALICSLAFFHRVRKGKGILPLTCVQNVGANNAGCRTLPRHQHDSSHQQHIPLD